MVRAGTIAILATAALALGACGIGAPTGKARAAKEKQEETGGLDLRRLAGTVKNPPDEFSVIPKRPLEMPKDLAALPAPQPGARSSREPDPVAEARAALLKSDGSATQTAAAAPSESETALLNASGASDPTIRATLAADQTNYEEEQQLYVLDRIIPALRRLRGEDSKDIIRPQEEYQRLNTTAASPAARTARSTPIAVIPQSAPAQPSTPAAPQAIPPAAPVTQGPAVSPAPGTDGELIYIPE